jgi:sugar/nucleoside kinase (ribokinase family)
VTVPAAGAIYVAGNVNVDLILGPVAPWPRVGTETVLPHYELRVGGQAGNAALALAALGVRHCVIATMGDDALGQWLRATFGADAAAWPRVPSPATVTVGLLHPDGERTFFTNTGHLATFAPDDVLAQLPARATEGDVVLLCGVFLSPALVAGGHELCAELARRGFALALDVGWPDQGWPAVRGAVATWLPHVDHVLFNELETLAVADAATLADADTWFDRRLAPGATRVVKRGPDGADGRRRGQTLHRSAPVVDVVDTVGAGDTFNAGYLAGVVRGDPLARCLEFGIDVASRAISTSPRRYDPSPTPAAISRRTE